LDFEDESGSAPRTIDSFWPSALLAAAFVGWLGFQTWQLIGERSQLQMARATQDQPLEQAQKIRASLDTLATSTRSLAAEGSAAARTVVEELAKRGVTINANGAAASTPTR
jgi:hypothetical protein